jgi:hypothetical protein
LSFSSGIISSADSLVDADTAGRRSPPSRYIRPYGLDPAKATFSGTTS